MDEVQRRGLQGALNGGAVRMEAARRVVLWLEAPRADMLGEVAGLTRREVEVYWLEREGFGADANNAEGGAELELRGWLTYWQTWPSGRTTTATDTQDGAG